MFLMLVAVNGLPFAPPRLIEHSTSPEPGFDHACIGADLAGKHAGVDVGAVLAQATQEGGA
jgi:hypothetical protein